MIYIDSIVSPLVDVDNKIGRNDTQLKELLKRLDGNTDQLTNVQTDVTKIRSDINKMVNDDNKLRADIDEVSRRITVVENKPTETSDITSLQASIDSIRGVLDSHVTALGNVTKKMGGIHMVVQDAVEQRLQDVRKVIGNIIRQEFEQTVGQDVNDMRNELRGEMAKHTADWEEDKATFRKQYNKNRVNDTHKIGVISSRVESFEDGKIVTRLQNIENRVTALEENSYQDAIAEENVTVLTQENKEDSPLVNVQTDVTKMRSDIDNVNDNVNDMSKELRVTWLVVRRLDTVYNELANRMTVLEGKSISSQNKIDLEQPTVLT